MARTVTPLNDTQIKNAKASDKNYTLSDGQGLQLLIKTNGTKLWEIFYKDIESSKRRKTSIGTYPSVSLSNARKKRAEYLELLHSGVDPIDKFKTKKQVNKLDELKKTHTIESIVDKHMEKEKYNKQLKDYTVKKAISRLKLHFISHLPQKEKTLIHNITFDMIVKILKKLEQDNKLETLGRVKKQIVKIFQYSYSENIIEDTEVFAKLELKSFKAYQESQARNNPTLTREEDIRRLYNDIQNYSNNLITKYLLIFTIHTAQRQGSIIQAKWEEIDFDRKLWTIPKENMKGRSTKVKEHYVPLSDVLINYLKELHNITGDDDYIFPNSQIRKTRNKYPHISNNTTNNALRLMGYTSEQQTAHGFRAMFKTICKENQEKHKLNNEFVERVLAHKVDGDVEATYNRAKNIEDMRKVLEWYSLYLENLV